MTTVFVGGVPPVVDDWLEERRRLGQDGRDEVWEGVLHVAPHAASGHGRLEAQVERLLYDRAVAAGLIPGGRFNLGRPGDYRVPDVGYHRDTTGGAWVAAADLIVEIRSPGDETDAKRGFYARHGVVELLILDPPSRSLAWWHRRGDGYVEATRSDLLDVDAATLTAEITWP